jgi:hypothetical protein
MPTRYKAYVGELNINYTKITTITNDDEVSNCKIFCNISISGESYKEHRFIRFIISPKVTIVNNNTSSNTDVSLSFTIHDGDNRNSLISTCSTYIMTLEPSMHGLLSTVCFVLDTRTNSLSYEK